MAKKKLKKKSKKVTVGSRHNNNKLRWRNFPMFLMEPLVAVGDAAEKRPGNDKGKYETFNFLLGQYVNNCLDSLKRHTMKLESPYHSDIDEESGISHAAHIAWNALVIDYVLKYMPHLDDRWVPKKSKR